MISELNAKACALRKSVLDMVYRAKAGHIGGDMSVLDVLTALYFGVMNVAPDKADDPDRDRFIMSKGHAVEALYAVLAGRGFIEKEELETYFQFGSRLIGHPNNKIRGIEMNTGALGHGLPVGVGMALAARMDARGYRTYVVMGDGELAEGSVWEAVMSAGHFGLGNLCAVVDRNKLQISGGTEQVMAHGDLAARFRAFGWNVIEADGHDYAALLDAFAQAKACTDRPSVLLANTVKGKGISFMEDKVAWHHKVPNEAEYAQATAELAQREKEAVR